jgi:peptide chain release factor 2
VKLTVLRVQRNEKVIQIEINRSDVRTDTFRASRAVGQHIDLHTNHETGNTQAVLDGDLDPFIEASLKAGASLGTGESAA